ncbi:MAG: choice-of-anchor tandem repeat GloVer-containing protein [Limisphaerales bacterium]
MNLIKNLLLKTGVLLLALAVSTASGAVTLDTLYSFGHNTNNNGSLPVGLVQGADGNFYGTTDYGGTNGCGTVFRISMNGGLTAIAFFNGTNGYQPVGQLVQGMNGACYGTTLYGGTNGGYGTVFQVTTNGVLTSLVSFTNDGIHGYYPAGDLTAGADGNFYGTTYYGGTNGDYGTIYKMTPAGMVNTLVSFAGTNGYYPAAGLVQGADGNFYGTTYYGGTNGGYGTVYKVTPGGVITPLHSFNDSDGYMAEGLIQAADGNLYGTTYAGGTYNLGTIFKVTTNGVFASLYSLSNVEGYGPASLVQGQDGLLYGMTYNGGTNGVGTIFKITTNGVFTSLHAFNYFDGYAPDCVLFASDGNLYGTAQYGGTYGYGTIFKATTDGVVTTLWSFDNYSSTDGTTPDKPVQGAGGLFYGTTESGGAYGYGTIYAMATNGSRTGLYSFTGMGDGSQPFSLAQARDGSYYGVTEYGGTNGNGTIFKVATNGVFDTLYELFYDDGNEPSSLVQGLDGNLYGTAYNGGMNGYGTIFKVTTNGLFTCLHTFNSDDGANPVCLVQRNDGNFYGITDSGTNWNGAIFKMTANGTFTTLYLFNGDDGSEPGALVQGLDGNLYGTTYGGGTNYNGTIFRMTTNGTLTTLYSFSGVDGSSPNSLVPGSDGNLYGCTSGGGTNGYGILFKLKTNGTFVTLHEFNYDDGAPPVGLVQGKDHNFYGTTHYGGANGSGTFFRLNVPAAPAIATQPASLICLQGALVTFTVDADGVLPLRYQWQKNSTNLVNGGNVSGATSSTLTLNNVSMSDAGIYSVVITNLYGSVTSSNAILTVLPTLAEALNATNLVWTTGGDADWFGQPWTTHDGWGAGQSGIIIDSQISWMETTVTGPGTLTFWWNVSSEEDYDFLFFSVNDDPRAAISGEVDWQPETFNLGAGSQTLSWSYVKDFSVSLGADCGWVDQVSFVPVAITPFIQHVFQTNHNFCLEWNALPGRMYQAQYSTNLVQPNWINLGAPGTNGTLSTPIGPEPQRFFRILLLP